MKVAESLVASPTGGPPRSSPGGPPPQPRRASVPVVVLGASLGGLAAAVSIRSRTGRAVCVLEFPSSHFGCTDTSSWCPDTSHCTLTSTCLDALRAINPYLYKSVMLEIGKGNKENHGGPPSAPQKEEGPPGGPQGGAGAPKGAPIKKNEEGPPRIGADVLREAFAAYLSSGPGGVSFLLPAETVTKIELVTKGDGKKGDRDKFAGEETGKEEARRQEVVLSLGNGLSIATDLVVVAEHRFQWAEWLKGLQGDEAQLGDRTRQEETGETDGKSFYGFDVGKGDALTPGSYSSAAPSPLLKLNTASTIASPSSLCIHSGAESGIASPVEKAPWGYWGGHLVLMGAAVSAPPSPCAGRLELVLEDAAQLGCSLFDWKFCLQMAIERFESIRKRRRQALEQTPWRGWTSTFSPRGGDKETKGDKLNAKGDSTNGLLPSVSFWADQPFVPTRDAYAELLPAKDLAYDVQEADFR